MRFVLSGDWRKNLVRGRRGVREEIGNEEEGFFVFSGVERREVDFELIFNWLCDFE